jgi:zinc protease
MRSLLAPALVLTLQAQTPEVQELRLNNGMRVLLIDRPGLGAIQATLAFRGGSAEEPGHLVGATELLARELFGATPPEAVETGPDAKVLDGLLQQEEARHESSRIAKRRNQEQGTDGVEELEASLRALVQKRLALLKPMESDLYTSRGIRIQARAESDLLSVSIQLPKEQLPFVLRTEVQRIKRLALPRFSESRQTLIDSLAQPSQGFTLLAGAALPGHPYGRDLRDHRGGIEALRLSELRTFARTALSADRALLVLAGDLQSFRDRALFEQTFGSLSAAEYQDVVLPDLPLDLGERRIQATPGGEPSLLMGWRVPAARTPDHLPLKALWVAWSQGPNAILHHRLVEEKGLARSITGGQDAPGGRLPGLWWVELRPAEGVSLQALEAGVLSEALRLQQELISTDQWKSVTRRMELDRSLLVEQPAALSDALVHAWAQEGDWRRVLTEGERLSRIGPESIQTVARRLLVPSHRTVAMLEKDPLMGGDPLDPLLADLLKRLASRRLSDPYQIETVVQEGLRQMRMLPKEERERTLRLLQAQLSPGAAR